MTTQEHKHHWRAYGQQDGIVVCDECNTGADVNALIDQARKEAAIEELEWADNKFDSLLQATEDGDRVHPGEYYEAIEDRIKALKEGK